MNVAKRILGLSLMLSAGLTSLLWGGAEQLVTRNLKFVPGPAVEWHSMESVLGSRYGDAQLGMPTAWSPVEYAAVLRIALRPGETIKNAGYLYGVVREGFGGRLEKEIRFRLEDATRFGW